MPQFNDKVKLYRKGLSKDIQAAHWTSIPIWSRLQGHTMGMEGAYPKSAPHGSFAKKALRPSFKPVEVYTDLAHEGGWEMDMLVHYPLTDKASYGDSPALGTGETKKFSYYKALINEVVKTVKVKDGLMGEQAVKNKTNILSIIKGSKIDIQDWYLRWSANAHWDAMFRGYSDNIIAPKAEGGFGDTILQRSHPNMYTAGNGKVTWSDTPATYESNVATDLGSLTTGDELTVARLRSMVATAPNLKIRKAVFGKGADYYIIIIDSYGAYQLQSDPKWESAQANAAARSSETNKLFTGVVEGYIEGAYIMVDDNMPGARVSGSSGYDAARGTVNYHKANPLETPIDDATIRFAVLLGASAISVATCLPIQFKSEVWEFDRHKEDAGISIIGYNRTDIYDEDGYFGTAGNYKENVSSLALAYYAGAGISF